MRYDLIIITTFVDKQHIDNLFQSVIENNTSVDILMVVVDQLGASAFTESDNGKVHLEWVFTGRRLSLSKARNSALEYLRRHNIRSKHVMFPDDDSTFDDIFFARYSKIVQADKSYLTVVYDQGSWNYYLSSPKKEGRRLGRKDFKYSSSVNMIITHDVVQKAGDFDERLGSGTEYGSCEDLDYYIRACEYTDFVFTNRLYTFHPGKREMFMGTPLNKLLRKYASYCRGYSYFVVLHGLFMEAPKSIARAFAASIYFFLRLELKRSVVQLYAGLTRLKYTCVFLARYNSLFGGKN